MKNSIGSGNEWNNINIGHLFVSRSGQRACRGGDDTCENLITFLRTAPDTTGDMQLMQHSLSK